MAGHTEGINAIAFSNDSRYVATASDDRRVSATIDFDHIVADIDQIRRYIPQRYEMEQLTAIVYEDLERNVCVGYKDVTPDEFWTRGHMPGMPLMPGVRFAEFNNIDVFAPLGGTAYPGGICGAGGKDLVGDPAYPGYPDLVIGMGRRVVPIARWIKRDSGGRSRVVLLGRKAANDSRTASGTRRASM